MSEAQEVEEGQPPSISAIIAIKRDIGLQTAEKRRSQRVVRYEKGFASTAGAKGTSGLTVLKSDACLWIAGPSRVEGPDRE